MRVRWRGFSCPVNGSGPDEDQKGAIRPGRATPYKRAQTPICRLCRQRYAVENKNHDQSRSVGIYGSELKLVPVVGLEPARHFSTLCPSKLTYFPGFLACRGQPSGRGRGTCETRRERRLRLLIRLTRPLKSHSFQNISLLSSRVWSKMFLR